MKEKILYNSILIFNEKGIQKTTMRDIASKMGISDGHVRYYFKKKEDLLIALFNELDKEILAKNQPVPSLEEMQTVFHQILTGVFEVMLKYQFFFLESPTIIKKFPELNKSYIHLYEKRRVFFNENLNELIKLNILRNNITDEEKDFLFNQFFMITDNWIRFNYVLNSVWKNEKNVNYYVELTIRLFIPYFNF